MVETNGSMSYVLDTINYGMKSLTLTSPSPTKSQNSGKKIDNSKKNILSAFTSQHPKQKKNHYDSDSTTSASRSSGSSSSRSKEVSLSSDEPSILKIREEDSLASEEQILIEGHQHHRGHEELLLRRKMRFGKKSSRRKEPLLRPATNREEEDQAEEVVQKVEKVKVGGAEGRKNAVPPAMHSRLQPELQPQRPPDPPGLNIMESTHLSYLPSMLYALPPPPPPAGPPPPPPPPPGPPPPRRLRQDQAINNGVVGDTKLSRFPLKDLPINQPQRVQALGQHEHHNHKQQQQQLQQLPKQDSRPTSTDIKEVQEQQQHNKQLDDKEPMKGGVRFKQPEPVVETTTDNHLINHPQSKTSLMMKLNEEFSSQSFPSINKKRELLLSVGGTAFGCDLSTVASSLSPCNTALSAAESSSVIQKAFTMGRRRRYKRRSKKSRDNTKNCTSNNNQSDSPEVMASEKKAKRRHSNWQKVTQRLRMMNKKMGNYSSCNNKDEDGFAKLVDDDNVVSKTMGHGFTEGVNKNGKLEATTSRNNKMDVASNNTDCGGEISKGQQGEQQQQQQQQVVTMAQTLTALGDARSRNEFSEMNSNESLFDCVIEEEDDPILAIIEKISSRIGEDNTSNKGHNNGDNHSRNTNDGKVNDTTNRRMMELNDETSEHESALSKTETTMVSSSSNSVLSPDSRQKGYKNMMGSSSPQSFLASMLCFTAPSENDDIGFPGSCVVCNKKK